MKTLNIFKSVVIAVVIAASSNVNAQTKADSAHVQDQREKVAFVVGAMRGTANDVEFSAPEVKNSLVTSVTGVRHSSIMVGAGVGATMMFNNATDEYGSSTVTSATAIIGMEYIFKHKEDAKVALFARLDAIYNSKIRVENLETVGWGALASFGAMSNPCGKLHVAAMAKVGYINRTSQRCIANDVAKGNVDWNSNALVVGGSLRFSYTVGYTKKNENYNVMGQIITGKAKTPIDAFLEIGGLYDNIKKPKVNGVGSTLNQGSGFVLVGLNFGL